MYRIHEVRRKCRTPFIMRLCIVTIQLFIVAHNIQPMSVMICKEAHLKIV